MASRNKQANKHDDHSVEVSTTIINYACKITVIILIDHINLIVLFCSLFGQTVVYAKQITVWLPKIGGV